MKKDRRAPVSIQTKLIQMQMSIAVISILACSLAFVANGLYLIRHSVERSIESTAKVLGENLTPTLIFLDSPAATKIMATLRSEPSISSAFLFDSSGKKIGPASF